MNKATSFQNWNATPKKAESIAYINKNTADAAKEDARIEELANGALKSAKEMMKDMKSQGLLFHEEKDGKDVTAKAVVKVEPALDKTKPETKVFQGKKVTDYPPKLNANGEQIYNVSVTIYHGSQNLTLFGGQRVDDEGKVALTGMRWSNFNRNNPKASPNAVGNDAIQASKASSELKALAQAIEDGGYISDRDVAVSSKTDLSDAHAKELVGGMKRAVKEIVQDMKKQDKMLMLTSQDGSATYPAKAFISAIPRKDKDGNLVVQNEQQQFWVQASLRKDNDSLVLFGGSAVGEDGKLPIRGMKFGQYNEDSPADSINIVGNAKIQESDIVPAEFKELAQAITDGGYITEAEYSELRNFAYELNTEVFQTKVEVEVENEDGTTEMKEKKLLNASYTPETDREDGEGTYAENVMIFNKAQPEVLVKFTDTDEYGHSVAAINTAYTNVEVGTTDDGKPIYETVPKSDPSDKAAMVFINSAEDVVNFLPNLPELHEAIARFMPDDISLESIHDALEAAGAEGVEVSGITEKAGQTVTDENGVEVEVDGFDNGQSEDYGDFEGFEDFDGEVPF